MLTVDGRSDLALGTKHNSMEATMNGTMGSVTSSPSSLRQTPHLQHRHMWIVTGPAGCGKSTVAQSLSNQLAIPYLEGDDFHPPANVLKMSKGFPLDDVDRWDWLVTLRDAAVSALQHTTTSATPAHTGVVVTCSALKRKYRDVIRVAAYNDHQVQVHFIYLHASEETLLQRVAARKGHYMGAKMVHSQFLSLEEPCETECKRDVLSVDCSGPMDLVAVGVMERVRTVLEADSGR